MIRLEWAAIFVRCPGLIKLIETSVVRVDNGITLIHQGLRHAQMGHRVVSSNDGKKLKLHRNGNHIHSEKSSSNGLVSEIMIPYSESEYICLFCSLKKYLVLLRNVH